MRPDGRAPDELRPTLIEVGVLPYPEGSCMISTGLTKVLCAATVEERVPPFRKGGIDGRSQEIQRLIGRSLRAAVDFSALGERSILIDCDVIVADGGTRTAAITGGYVALALAVRALEEARVIGSKVLRRQVAAVSAGIVGGEPRLDLCYLEDSAADTDLNCVGADDGRFIEIQGTAEGAPFSRQELDRLLALADLGLTRLFAVQAEALATGVKTG
jgi:ribonuclease PH